jgi:hypothetical protein
MASFNTVGTSLTPASSSWAGGGGGWADVAQTGINVLGGWAQAKAQRKATKQQLKLMRAMGGPASVASYDPRLMTMQAGNPFMAVNPRLGSTMSLTGPSLPSRGVWDFPPLPEIAEGVFDTIGEGAVSLGEAIFGGGAPVATTTAVATRRTSPPRIVGAIDNASGKSFFYRYVGAPILFRGDLTTLKTAKKAVSKFGGLVRTGGTFRRKRRC